jgi:hypothetical protein
MPGHIVKMKRPSHFKRLYLTKVAEESDKDKIDCIRRKTGKHHTTSVEEKHLVYYNVDKVRPLIGD